MTDAPVSTARAGRVIGFVLLPIAVFIVGRIFAARAAEGEGEDKLILCRHADLDEGNAQRTDLAQVKRAYATLKTDLEMSLAAQKAKALGMLDLTYDSGLPRCRSAGKRMFTLKDPLPQQFRGRTYYFVNLSGGFDDVPWESEIAKDERAEILVIKAARPALAGDLARRLKRPITFATKDLADALGIECGPAMVSVGENGRDLVIAEGP